MGGFWGGWSCRGESGKDPRVVVMAKEKEKEWYFGGISCEMCRWLLLLVGTYCTIQCVSRSETLESLFAFCGTGLGCMDAGLQDSIPSRAWY